LNHCAVQWLSNLAMIDARPWIGQVGGGLHGKSVDTTRSVTRQPGVAEGAEWLDPLTGWAGGAETQSQVNLRFPTAEAAIAYCEREGHDFKVVPAPRRKLLLQSYADNFR
jgi:hypothetical protein